MDLKIVSIYSGAGGLDVGFHKAGFRTVFATDIWDVACDTLKRNFRNTEVECKSIVDVDFTRIREKYGHIDGLVGGPPCPPFSKSRFYRTEKERGMNDADGELTLRNYFRALHELKPSFFVFENVHGFVYRPHQAAMDYLKKEAEDMGYSITYQVVNTADYGVPQTRERFICVGVRKPWKPFVFPSATHADLSKDGGSGLKPWVTAGDVLSDIDHDMPEDIYMEAGSKHKDLLKLIPPGDNYLFFTKERNHPDPIFKWRSRYWSFLLKLSPDRPSWTIQASHSNNMGPFHWKNRFLRIPEIKRLQTFDDDYRLEGGFRDQWRQVGNAVPPRMAYVIATRIREMYFDKIKDQSMIRYEADPRTGRPVEGEPFTEFDERTELESIFENLNWNAELMSTGRGGYYLYELEIGERTIPVHIYLKRVTFGGRPKRPYEKRAQFTASLDRRGFNAKGELSLILGIYKSDVDSPPVICAWDINDWGYNEGRAFNCFVDVRKIAQTYLEGYVVSRTAIGQVVYSFLEAGFPEYLDQVKVLNRYLEEDAAIEEDELVAEKDGLSFNLPSAKDDVPTAKELMQTTLDILKLDKYQGKAHIKAIEQETADLFDLDDEAREVVHNFKEGLRTELGYQLAWARTYLKLAGLIYNAQWCVWALTEKGWQTENLDTDQVYKTEIRRVAETEFKNDIEEPQSEDGVECEIEDIKSGEITHPFDPGKVDIRTRSMTLDLILKRLKHGAIDLNTGFQRRAGLWDIGKQSRLIESILIKFPLPAFYFDGSDDEQWLVVDGLQRITALDMFVNKQEFRLSGLEFLTDHEGRLFSELPVFLQRRIEEFEITAYIIAAGTPDELKYNVFKRINTGGLILTSQEIRNALYQGTPVNFVRELSQLPSFKKATGFSISEERMLDQEFVTRFLAFYMLDHEKAHTSDLDTFLNKAMASLADYEWNEDTKSPDLLEIRQVFIRTMEAMLFLFGDYAFRKLFDMSTRKNPINKALFDSWSVTLARMDESQIEALKEKKNVLVAKFMQLMNNSEDFNKAISASTGDRSRIRRRFKEIANIVESTLTGN